VIDYAECRPGLLPFLKNIATRPADETAPLRIVLLAREIADWWHSLQEQDDGVRHLLQQFEPVIVSQIPLEGELRSRVFTHARDAYAAVLKKPIPKNIPNLDDTRYARILYLHMAALASAEGMDIAADTLIHDIVDHEKHYWMERYKTKYHNDNLETMDFMERCGRFVAALTLRGGAPTRDEAGEINHRVNGPEEPNIARFFRLLYPGRQRSGEGRYMSGLEPDILGEALVADVLSDANTPGDYLDCVFENAGETALIKGVVTRGRISRRRETEAREWLRRVLDADVAGRALPAFRAAMTLGQESPFAPLGLVLAEGLAREGTVEHAAEIEHQAPLDTVSLRETAAWATRRRLDSLGAEDIDDETAIERAWLLNNLGNRLSDLGCREEALAAAQEAVDIRRGLAKTRPDAFLPDLALSLGAHGSILRDIDRLQDAGVSFEEGVRTLQPLFLKLPAAHAKLMAQLVSVYIATLEKIGEKPDMDLLAPIVEKLKEISEGQ
jgi:tetratricopeptide (TPR) repeat protein